MSSPEEQRVVPRYPLPKEKMKFVFEECEKVFAVRDISSLGLGISLLEYGEALLFPQGYQCTAELKLEGDPMFVKVRVTRVSAWSVGFVFDELSAEQRERIVGFIDPLHVAFSLKKVDQKGAPDAFLRGMSNWYHGDSATDLFFWNGTQGALSRALFCFGRRYWEWDESLGVSTGEMQRLEGDKVVMHKDVTPDPRTCASVRKVLEHADVLDYRLVSFLKEKT
ncbi:MAG TPA: PilZ domain-containing protein [Bdellovibrionota bacterium]